MLYVSTTWWLKMNIYVTWRGGEHHTRKLERARISIEVARWRLGSSRSSGGRRQALHWTPVHQLHHGHGHDGRDDCRWWRESVAGRRKSFLCFPDVDRAQNDQIRSHRTFVVVPLLLQNSGNCDRRCGTSRMSLPDSAAAFLPFPRPVAWRRMPADRLNTPASPSPAPAAEELRLRADCAAAGAEA